MCGHKDTKVFLKKFLLFSIADYLAPFVWYVDTVRSVGSEGH